MPEGRSFMEIVKAIEREQERAREMLRQHELADAAAFTEVKVQITRSNTLWGFLIPIITALLLVASKKFLGV